MRNIFKRRKKFRGKSKSAEAKLKETKARVDSLVMTSWLKMLREDPELLRRIAEERHGGELQLYGSYDGEHEFGDRDDLLSVLRKAKEAKALLKDELGESKGSWIRDFAEIVRALPDALAALGKINLAALQNPQFNPQIAQRQIHQITQSTKQTPPSGFNELELEKLMSLLQLSPQEAWEALKAGNEVGWVNYLKSTSYEEFSATLTQIGESNPEYREHIESFLKEFHPWIQQLLTIASKETQK